VETDDFENVDPVLSAKRSKASDNFFPAKDLAKNFKPSPTFLFKSASTGSVVSPAKAATPRPRSLLHPKFPAAKLNTSIAKSSPLSAPAGRSPTRGKRCGILSARRRTAGSYSRVDPPIFGLGASVSSSPAPFSLDAALKGTIPSYGSRNAATTSQSTPASRNSSLSDLGDADMKSSWFFDIHEDTPEQEMTNMLQHSTCVLDISSDEESESRRQRERVEGKENVPPVDDVSQTSRPRTARAEAGADDMIVEKERNPLGEMDVRDYYAEGCDETSVIIVPGDEGEEHQATKHEFSFNPELKLEEKTTSLPEPAAEDGSKTVEELMQQPEEPAPSAAVLEPIEGTGESFEVWESRSSKDEAETPVVC
jgi:hypothetical protein